MRKVVTSFEHLAELWDAKGKDRERTSDVANVKAILSLLGKPVGKTVYEIACGNGSLSRKIKKAGAKEVYASDPSPTLLGFAQNKYDPMGIKYSLREGSDFVKLPKNKFDAIIIHQGIFYIKNIPKLMRGSAKLLKRKGSIIFTVTHPTFQVFKGAEEIIEWTGKNSVVEKLDRYTTNHTAQVHKKWLLNGEPHEVSYIAYNRPLQYYVDQCTKAGLLIEAVKETAAKTRTKKGVVSRKIPGSFVIKAVKI